MKFFLPLLFFFLVVLAGCQNADNKNYETALSDSTSIFGLTGDSVKLVKTASINLKVADVGHSVKELSGLAQTLGGMVFHQNLQAVIDARKELKLSQDSLLVVSGITPRAEVTVRVPSQNLEAFFYGAADLGYFTDQSTLHIDDRSLLYLENSLKQRARKESLANAPATKGSVQKTIDVKDEMIQQLIANKTIDADAAYSAVDLRLFQNTIVRKETVANNAVADYELSFGHRLGNALNEGWSFFVTFFLALVHLWVFVLLALGLFLVYLFVVKKKMGAAAIKIQ